MIGILVHGDNHFIVRGPLPGKDAAHALVRHWSLIRIGAEHPEELSSWSVVSRAFREELEWAVHVPGDGMRNPAVAQLLAELLERGVALVEY